MTTVRDKFGHQIKLLTREAGTLGLVVGDDDRAVLTLIDDTDAMIDSRYIRPGPSGWRRSMRRRAPAKASAMVSAPSCAAIACQCGLQISRSAISRADATTTTTVATMIASQTGCGLG
jgi:hypothetical protein